MRGRHGILVAVMAFLALPLVPAYPLLKRVPELLIPAFAAYALAFFIAYRIALGRSLVVRLLAAAGFRAPPPRKSRGSATAARVALNLFLAASFVLGVTVAALWDRSLRSADKFERTDWDVLGVTPSRWVRRLRDSRFLWTERGVLGYERKVEIVTDPRYVLDPTLPVEPKPFRVRRWTQYRAFPFTPRFRTYRGSDWPRLGMLGIEHFEDPKPPRFPGDPPQGVRSVAVRFRLLFAVAAAPALCAAGLYVSRLRRPRPGHCANCDYDLRATPGRCPECGEEPAERRSPNGQTPMTNK